MSNVAALVSTRPETDGQAGAMEATVRPGSATAASAVHWPPPPFFEFAEVDVAARRECTIDLVDGSSVSGQLLSLGPAAPVVRYRPAGQDTAHVDLRHVRKITLVRLVPLVRDESMMRDLGTSERSVASERRVALAFPDGQTITGKTRGFVRSAAGVFLYLLVEGSSFMRACFVPAHQVADLQIGPLLGDALAGLKIASGDVIANALERQSQLRDERLGDYLTDRAIVSPADLTRALRAQGKRPAIRLGEFLIKANLISEAQLDEALKIQHRNRKRRLGDILVEMGAVSIRQVQTALAEKLGIPYVNVRDIVIEPATLRLLNPKTALQHQVLPLLRNGETLVVAVENPLGMDFSRGLSFTTGLNVVPVIANPDDLRVRIASEYPTTSGTKPAPRERAAARAGMTTREIETLADQLEREARPAAERDVAGAAAVADNALVRLVNKIIIDAYGQHASDIHIESNPRTQGTRVRFRKDGELEDYLELQPSFRSAVVSRLKVMAGLDIAERRFAQDGKIEFGRFGPLAIELRVATIPTTNNLEDVVLRILGGAEPLPLDQLGLSARDLEHIRAMVGRNHGLLVACGPTGSGKTTTLHSLLRQINRPDLKIWTAEDPVEITQPGLRQVQINAAIGWTFAAAMRAFLRADPDVIMVGEMRDAETARTAIEASLTGHLVMSTLHTNSAAESLVRLLDLGMDPFNFADALVGVLAQRLVRKLCPLCRERRVLPAADATALLDEYCANSALDRAVVLSEWRRSMAEGGLVLYEAVGCDACKNGYRGRIGIYELLVGTPAIKHLVRNRAQLPDILAVAQREGMRTLRQDAIDKALGGMIDLASARAAAS